MPDRPDDEVVFRAAGLDDAPAIGRLHADSWRRNYRTAYPPEFFGPQLDEDRATVWIERLSKTLDGPTTTTTTTILALDRHGDLVGFVHLVFDDDPEAGTLLDNLHVRHDAQRRGTGRQLLGRAAGAVVAHTTSGMYLWVLEPNVRAQDFYRALGATVGRREPAEPPALPGIGKLQCAWDAAQVRTLS